MIKTRLSSSLLPPLLALSLSGCMHYTAAPIDPKLAPQAFDARALPARTQPASEADLIRIGVQYAPTLHDAASAYRNAVAAVRTSRVRPLGTLTLASEYSHDDNPQKPWLGGVALDLPLDIGGRRTTRLDAANLAVVQARYDYLEALWQLRSAVHHSLIELRAIEAEMPLDSESLTIRRAREARLNIRVAAGEDPRSLALVARTDRAAAERRAADTQARKAIALSTLAKAIGLPAAAVAHLSFAPQAGLDVPAPATLAKWRSDAALARPDVLRALADYDLAEGALKLEVAKQYPEIHLGPGYTYERGLTKLPFNIGLVLPPTDFNRAAIREMEQRRAAAGTKIEGLQAGTLAAVDSAAAALAVAIDNEKRATKQDLPIVRIGLDQARRSLASGEGDRVDEMAAHAALIDAEIAAGDTARLSRLARADLDDAARPPLDPAETMIFTQAMQSLETRK